METTTKNYTTGFVTSNDGTKIYYRKLGSGDGLVLVHGALMYSENFMRLAEFLADDFTVYIPDRCGRGLSEMHPDYSLQRESEDISALLNETHTKNIFGLSSGAVITLQTAISNAALKKVALYEPPLLTDKSAPYLSKMTQKYYRAMRKQNYGKAFAGIIKDTGDKGFFMKYLPNFILTPLMNHLFKSEGKKISDKDNVSVESLVSAMRYDLETVRQSKGILDKVNSISADILLLGGEKSISFLGAVLNQLSAKLPKAQKIILPKTGHTAAENNGTPEIVAVELKKFYNSDKKEE